MDLVKLLEISNPKGLRSIINTVIEEHNQNVEDVAAVKQQIDSTIPDALADRYTKSEVQALLEANQQASDAYTNAKIAALIDSAPETLDTFAEIAAAFAEDQAVLDALNSAIGLKVNKTELDNYYTKTASDALLNNKYVKPLAGIPKTDLASAVQESLDKADSALQALPEFKTINDESILGSGNIEITSGGGGITQADLLNLIYPVGSIYMSVNKVSPQTFLGGTWTQITTDAYLKIVTSNAGSADGTNSAHKIPIKSMPSHNHTQDGHNHLMVSSQDAAGSGDYMAGRYNADRNSSYPTRSITSWVQPTIHNTGDGEAYYPYYVGVYVWKRTA